MSDRETGGRGDGGSNSIRSHRDLRVWQNAMNAAMVIFEASKAFPAEERYSLTDQIRRASRSVASNVAEAWRKRRYKAAFISKLSDAEGEACEVQTWIEFSRRCKYLPDQKCDELDESYETIVAQIVTMINQADRWTLPPQGGK